MPADVLVLCYHGVSDTWPADTAVRTEQLERQLRFLLSRGYQAATFTRALVSPPGERTLAVTFDDGHRSVLEHAYPTMSSLGVPGTVFVPTDFVDTGRSMDWLGIDQWLDGPHRHELACLSWDELRALDADGWEIGSHGRSHARLPTLDDERLRDELRGSREACEANLGTVCRSLAYPYGDYDDRVLAATHEAGYRLAATVPTGYEAPLPLRWPRLVVTHQDGRLRFRRRASRTMRHVQSTAGGRLLLGALRGPWRAARSAIRPSSSGRAPLRAPGGPIGRRGPR